MADIINSVDRSLDMYIYDLYIYRYMPLLCEPNDAVRAVAVAKRREYVVATVTPILKRMCLNLDWIEMETGHCIELHRSHGDTVSCVAWKTTCVAKSFVCFETGQTANEGACNICSWE